MRPWAAPPDRRALVGVVHLLPLPGAPRPSRGLEAVCDRACADARVLAEGGADAAILENLGDAPFSRGAVAPYTVAAMTRIAMAVREAVPSLPLGINVLRNDARAALSVAAATGARFVRVNVHTGVMATDQGLIQGEAHATLLERNRLGAELGIAADVMVKHAVPLGDVRLEDVALDTFHRALADILIVTGRGTGRPTAPEDVARVRSAVPAATVWVGSGTTPETAARFEAHGFIVGTWIHREADLDAPLELSRVRAMRGVLDRMGAPATPAPATP